MRQNWVVGAVPAANDRMPMTRLTLSAAASHPPLNALAAVLDRRQRREWHADAALAASIVAKSCSGWIPLVWRNATPARPILAARSIFVAELRVPGRSHASGTK